MQFLKLACLNFQPCSMKPHFAGYLQSYYQTSDKSVGKGLIMKDVYILESFRSRGEKKPYCTRRNPGQRSLAQVRILIPLTDKPVVSFILFTDVLPSRVLPHVKSMDRLAFAPNFLRRVFQLLPRALRRLFS